MAGTRLAFALAGLGGFNAHGAGFLQAARDNEIEPDLVTATSGQIVDRNTTSVTKGAHLAYYRKVQGAIQQPCRSLSRGALIVIVLLSFGLWGIIWLAVALLASVWER